MMLQSFKGNTDEQLMGLVAKGDESAFGKLYEKYWRKAYLHAYKRLQDEDKAKDIVQEVFVNIWSRKEMFISNFSAYLSIAIRNQVIKLVAKERHIDCFSAHLLEVRESSTLTDSRIRKQEFYALYRKLVSGLPPKRREIFKLHHHDDLTTKVIATELGISVKTVQNQLGKAVKQIKDPLWRLCTT